MRAGISKAARVFPMRGSVHVITRGQLDYGSANKRKNPNFNLQRIYFGPNLARSRPHGTQRYRAEQLTRSSATRPPRALRFEMCALHAFLCLAVIGSASALEGAAGDALPLSGYSELNRVRRVEAEEAAAAAPDEQDEPLSAPNNDGGGQCDTPAARRHRVDKTLRLRRRSAPDLLHWTFCGAVSPRLP